MKRSVLTTACALACAVLFASQVEAKQKVVREACNGPDIMRPCMVVPAPQTNFLAGVRSITVTMTRERRTRRRASVPVYHAPRPTWADMTSIGVAPAREPSQVVGGRPSGCPRAFCGCGASLHLFGKIIPSLNLAANWLRFPRTTPAPKMVAARRGHVFVLEQHISGNVWQVFDANSGGRMTRLHARSISGFAIVDPSGPLDVS